MCSFCCLKNRRNDNDTDYEVQYPNCGNAEVIQLKKLNGKKELNVWVPSTSASQGTYNFYAALEHKLKKDGIRLRKIDKEELKDVVHSLAICNFCTRPEADIKEICDLDSYLQRKLFIIILYLNGEQRSSDNVRLVKNRCQRISNIVEMNFTTRLDNIGIKDEENKEALDKLKKFYKTV